MALTAGPKKSCRLAYGSSISASLPTVRKNGELVAEPTACFRGALSCQSPALHEQRWRHLLRPGPSPAGLRAPGTRPPTKQAFCLAGGPTCYGHDTRGRPRKLLSLAQAPLRRPERPAVNVTLSIMTCFPKAMTLPRRWPNVSVPGSGLAGGSQESVEGWA